MINQELEKAKTIFVRVAAFAAVILVLLAIVLFSVFNISQTIFFASAMVIMFLCTNFSLAKRIRAKIQKRLQAKKSQDKTQNTNKDV